VRSYNKGLAQAKGDILVCMNDDCRPGAGWLEPLVAAIEQEGLWLASPGWRHARTAGHCMCFPRAAYDLTGGFDERYRHWCADQVFELTLIDSGKPIRQVSESNVYHDPGDFNRINYRKSAKVGNWEELPNTGQWYNEDQAVYESIWGKRTVMDHWPEDWTKVR
jgi:hypothetical protein